MTASLLLLCRPCGRRHQVVRLPDRAVRDRIGHHGASVRTGVRRFRSARRGPRPGREGVDRSGEGYGADGGAEERDPELRQEPYGALQVSAYHCLPGRASEDDERKDPAESAVKNWFRSGSPWFF